MQVFFNPEIYNGDFTTPLPDIIDKCIQSAPIDTRRALYKVQVIICVYHCTLILFCIVDKKIVYVFLRPMCMFFSLINVIFVSCSTSSWLLVIRGGNLYPFTYEWVDSDYALSQWVK